MAKVELKAPIVEEIKANLEGAKSVVLVDYLGLTVEQDTNLRRATREAGLIYKVYKNTMVKRAIEGTEFAEIAKDLEGPTAVAISKDDARNLLRYRGNQGYFTDPFKRRASFKTSWKSPVTYY